MNRSPLRHIATVASAVLAGAVTVFVGSVVYGVATEYGAGAFGLLVLPSLVCLAPVAVALALWHAPVRRRLLLLVVAVLLVSGAVHGAEWAGERTHRDRLEAESAHFSCGPMVDDRVEAAFAGLPRPAPVYGPVEGSHADCTAGIAGGRPSYDAYRTAMARDGWQVVREGPDRQVSRRDDLVATLSLDGGVQPLLRIAVAD